MSTLSCGIQGGSMLRRWASPSPCTPCICPQRPQLNLASQQHGLRVGEQSKGSIKPTVVCAAKAAVAGKATAQAVTALPTAVAYAVMASAAYTGFLFALMVLLPRMTAVKRLMQSYWVFLPLALGYLALLAYSWSPDTLSTLLPGSLSAGFSGGFNPQFFPKLQGISALFSQPATAASWVLHILSINLFLGRSIYLEGVAQAIPTRLSLLVCCVFGPLGLLLHWLTKGVLNAFPSLRADSKQQVLPAGNGGRIIILPYDK